MNQVILFKAHNKYKQTLANYNQLASVSDNVVMLYDSTDKEPFENGFNYTFDDLKRYPQATPEQIDKVKDVVFQGHQSDLQLFQMQQWYNTGYPVLLYFIKNQNHDYYWAIEYDVFYNGNWKNFIDKFSDCDADLIAVDLKQVQDGDFFDKYLDFNVPYDERWSSYGFIQRYSSRLIKAVFKELKKGNHTHYEQLFPSICKHYGYKAVDMLEYATEKGFKPFTETSIYHQNIDLYKILMSADSQDKLFHRVK